MSALGSEITVFHFCSTENTIQKYDHNIPKGMCSHFFHLSGTCDRYHPLVAHTTYPASKMKMDFPLTELLRWCSDQVARVKGFNLSLALNLLCNLPRVTSLLWNLLSSPKKWGRGDYAHSFSSHHLARTYTLPTIFSSHSHYKLRDQSLCRMKSGFEPQAVLRYITP